MKRVWTAYTRTITNIYDRVTTNVRAQGGVIEDFPITIGLH